VEPPPGIIAWWPGENNAADIVGGNNGVLMGGVTYAGAVVGNGFAFDGSTGYVQLPQNFFPPPNASPFSLELWFETVSGGVILAQQTSAPSNYPDGGWLPEIYVGTDGNVYVQLFWDGSENQVRTTTPVNDGNFHHLAVTYDGFNETIYVDGSELVTKPLAYSSFTSGFYTQLGTGYTAYWPAGTGGWYPFEGIIDEPTLYNTALTAAQVQSIYDIGGGGKCTDSLLPVIISQPANQTVAAGATASFSVRAASLLPLNYQWLTGAVAVAGATNSAYILTNVAASASGSQFSCVVSNIHGATISAPATLITTGLVLNVSTAVLPNHDVQMTISGPANNVFRVLASTNFLTWDTIATLTNTTGAVQFTDSAATNFSCRFYRMVTP
jgi:hypothetical protein